MKTILLIVVISFYGFSVLAQPFVTRNGYIGFFSKTPLEDIRAENKQVVAAVDLQKKTIAFAALMKSFLFRKELMQQHFNENYVESDKYPKANFSGTYTGDVDTKKDGQYPIQVKGKLTLHGVTRDISTPAMMFVQNGKLTSTATFQLVPADFNIKIPAIVKDKIAERIDVSVRVDYPLK